jgi:uncharacterized HAD superfamily protein
MNQYRRLVMNIHPRAIAFDFDGVVADTFRLFIEIARSDYNVDVEYEDITDYEFLKVVDMNFADAMKIIDTLTYHPHELDLRPNRGAESVLARMALETSLLFVTARPIGRPVEMWFEKNMPLIQPEAITVMATSENTAKLPVLKEQGVAYFVDDRLDTCHLLSREGITPIVFDQPWNRQPHPFTTVKNWEDISRLINWEDE